MAQIDDLRQSVTAFAKTLDFPPFIHEFNELLDQHAWEQAAEEEKIAMQKIADMWMIVQSVATGGLHRHQSTGIDADDNADL